jgi:chromosome segregation ATPase
MQEKIDQIEKDIAGVKSEISSFKDGVTTTLDKLADATHELAIAVSNSKIRDDALKDYVEQNHNYLLEKQASFQLTLAEITKEQKDIKVKMSDVTTKQALNDRSIGDARKIFFGIIGSVITAGVLIWLGLK